MIIKLKDDKREFADGLNALQIAKEISTSLAKKSIAVKINGQLTSLNTVAKDEDELEFITFEDKEGREVYRHSASHIMAQAVKRIYPTVKTAIGPAIANGFYYDFDFNTPPSKDALELIEAEMKKIIKENLPIVREELSRAKALKYMQELGENYKIELIKELDKSQTISLYRQGDFVDLCRGPHVPSTGYIKAFKLTSITGAYWRGDERNKMLTRIYGSAFPSKAELDAYLEELEQAKKRDHNRIGKELDIFMTSEYVGQGLPLLMPKGAKLFQILNRFVEDEEEKRGYLLTRTPYMSKHNLYLASGHWEHYKDKMFIIGDENNQEEELLALRPMTCPFQFQIYNNGIKSYRDLPIRYAETSTLFRKEASGEMHGLIRIRQFTLSEGHIICTPEQIEKEFTDTIDFIYYILNSLGLRQDVSFRFSKWDPNDREKYIDNETAWNHTQAIMKKILDKLKMEYVEAEGEAAFYGPKLDIQIKNVHGKEDTLITVQVDFFLPERLDMSYIDENGQKMRPTIIHRSSVGCYERTMALLIEKYAGAFPTWLAPVQVKVLALTERTAQATLDITKTLKEHSIRAESDLRNEKIGYKIREARLEKIPYMVIIGDKEAEQGTLSVRSRKDGELGALCLQNFISRLQDEINNKIIN